VVATEDPDRALVREAQQEGPAGRAAAGALFARYGERVYAWCRRLVRDHEQALDLAQEALLLAYRSLPSFEGNCRFSSWLFAITRHRCLRELERTRHWNLTGIEPDDHVDGALGPVDGYENREELIRVLGAMESSLDHDERMALWLRCAEELPVEEITTMLGLDSASGARGLLQTARRKLRAALRERDTAGRGAQ
jgi:RNA polymerase sigma-70 factor (ECF subfamily)